MITTSRWKGGTSNDKKYFSEKRQEKVLTAVKNREKRTLGLLLAYTKLPTTDNHFPPKKKKSVGPDMGATDFLVMEWECMLTGMRISR